MDSNRTIEWLENEWDADGFLGKLRMGHFSATEGERFLSALRSIEIGQDELIPKRLISLIWYLPSFLEWQRERVVERGSDKYQYVQFVNSVVNALEDSIGVP